MLDHSRLISCVFENCEYLSVRLVAVNFGLISSPCGSASYRHSSQEMMLLVLSMYRVPDNVRNAERRIKDALANVTTEIDSRKTQCIYSDRSLTSVYAV